MESGHSDFAPLGIRRSDLHAGHIRRAALASRGRRIGFGLEHRSLDRRHPSRCRLVSGRTVPPGSVDSQISLARTDPRPSRDAALADLLFRRYGRLARTTISGRSRRTNSRNPVVKLERLAFAAGVGLFLWLLHRIGLAVVWSSLVRLGWGFVASLVLRGVG